MLSIRVRQGSPQGAVLPLAPRREILIGRSHTCGLLLQGPDVSGKHLRIFPHGEDLWVENLGRLGTKLNGVPLATPVKLKAGDSLELGRGTVLEVVDLPEEGASAPEGQASGFTTETQALGSVRSPPTGATSYTHTAAPRSSIGAPPSFSLAKAPPQVVPAQATHADGDIPPTRAASTPAAKATLPWPPSFPAPLTEPSSPTAPPAPALALSAPPPLSLSAPPPLTSPSSLTSPDSLPTPASLSAPPPLSPPSTRPSPPPPRQSSPPPPRKSAPPPPSQSSPPPPRQSSRPPLPTPVAEEPSTDPRQDGNETQYLRTRVAEPGEVEQVLQARKKARRKSAGILAVVGVVAALILLLSGPEEHRQLAWHPAGKNWKQEIEFSASTWAGERKPYLTAVLPAAARIVEITNEVNRLSIVFKPDPYLAATARLAIQVREMTGSEIHAAFEGNEPAEAGHLRTPDKVPWKGAARALTESILSTLNGGAITLDDPWPGIRHLPSFFAPMQPAALSPEIWQDFMHRVEKDPVFFIRQDYVRTDRSGTSWSGATFSTADGPFLVSMVVEISGVPFARDSAVWPLALLPGEHLARYRWDLVRPIPPPGNAAAAAWLASLSNQLGKVAVNLDLETKQRTPATGSLFVDELFLRSLLATRAPPSLPSDQAATLRGLQSRASDALQYSRDQLRFFHNQMLLKAKSMTTPRELEAYEDSIHALIQDPLDPRYNRSVKTAAP